MDIFEKRDTLLDLQGTMLSGKREPNNQFLSLMNFENWCTNSGMSGFAQDFQVQELKLIKSFAHQKQFSLVVNMIEFVESYIDQHGIDFINKLDEVQFERLSQFDDEFFDLADEFTLAVYDEFGIGR